MAPRSAGSRPLLRPARLGRGGRAGGAARVDRAGLFHHGQFHRPPRRGSPTRPRTSSRSSSPRAIRACLTRSSTTGSATTSPPRSTRSRSSPARAPWSWSATASWVQAAVDIAHKLPGRQARHRSSRQRGRAPPMVSPGPGRDPRQRHEGREFLRDQVRPARRPDHEARRRQPARDRQQRGHGPPGLQRAQRHRLRACRLRPHAGRDRGRLLGRADPRRRPWSSSSRRTVRPCWRPRRAIPRLSAGTLDRQFSGSTSAERLGRRSLVEGVVPTLVPGPTRRRRPRAPLAPSGSTGEPDESFRGQSSRRRRRKAETPLAPRGPMRRIGCCRSPSAPWPAA